jgi:trans-2,3-dihydro-3-hydroxyanthranilate isomerase
MPRVEIRQVDAFTDELFGGNPAGVVPDARGLSDRRMQQIAREMNLSETAFVTPPTGPGADFRVRFFTPGHEVDLCGHATIATFHVLAWTGRAALAGSRTTFVQETGAGRLPVAVESVAGRVAGVAMEQAEPQAVPSAPADAVAGALGIAADRLDPALPVEASYTGLWAVIAPLRDPSDLARLEPRPELFDALVPGVLLSGVYAFAPDGDGLRARFFVCPRYQILEDPFTGTAAGALGGYLLRRHRLGPGETVRIRQGIEMGRPGRATVRILPNGRVEVSGTAVQVFRSEIDVPET